MRFRPLELSITINRISKTMYWGFAKIFFGLEYRWYDKSEDTARLEEELEEDAVGGSYFDERRGGRLDQYQYTKKRHNVLLGE